MARGGSFDKLASGAWRGRVMLNGRRRTVTRPTRSEAVAAIAELTAEAYAQGDAAEMAFEEFAEDWETTYPAMIKSWRDTWEDFIPFLDFPAELRKIVYSTNAIESLNARFRKAAVRRGHFPTEQAAIKVLYLTAIERRKNRSSPTGRINGWKSILNTLSIHYSDRLAAATH